MALSFSSLSSSSSNSGKNGRVTRSRSSTSAPTEAERPRKSIRRCNYCPELGLPWDLMCNGCCLYCESPPSYKNGDRADTHTSPKFQCEKPWLKDPAKKGCYDLKWNVRYQKIRDFLLSQGHSTGAIETAMIKSTTPPSAGHSTTKKAIVTLIDELEVQPDGRSVPKEIHEVTLYSETILSMGHEFVVTGIPITHCVIPKNHLERLRNSERVMKELHSLYQHGRFPGGSLLMRSITAITVISCPALPLSQAANVMPLFVAGTLIDLGVLDRAKVSMFATSFPSETYLRDLVFSLAAECIYELGKRVNGLLVFLSCDKGNKKGVSHFVKILSWYDAKTKSVVKQLLDIDASEGTTEDCGDAIAASLKKVGNIKLQGQSTDSGGGGVLDGLHQALVKRDLCRQGYLVASCSLHNLQLSVANPIKVTMGEGGLEKKNVMQLLHSVYDLQESVDRDVWKMHVEQATEFLLAFGAADTPYVGDTDADQQFAAKWELIKTFRPFGNVLSHKEINRTNFKIPAPVLTRWWSVGETAKATWPSYLLLFRISQQVINATSSKQNKIASGLQPLMLEPQLFSDLSLLHCFHTYYVSPHFDWMQSATDMSGIPGFQSHNTLGRYFLMVQDLTALATTISTTHPAFVEFRETLNVLTPQIQQHQINKASHFVSTAIDALNKHFTRWCNASLLPAALLSETPLCIVVASVILKKMPPPVIPLKFESKVHFRTFNVPEFYDFVVSKVDAADQYPDMVSTAARLVLKWLDVRDMNKEDHNRPFKEYLYYLYLPLASQTQFVEAGVKEAKNVSPTDRSEQLRSAYAVARSARVHTVDCLGLLKSTKRIEGLLESAIQHYEIHETFKEENEDYADRIADIANVMRKEHFKQARVDKVQQSVLGKVNKNKKENQLQKKTGVDQTHAMDGLFPYGKLFKELHLAPLKEELLYRGCSEDELNGLTIKPMKNKLKELEIKRIEDDNDADGAAKAAAHKAFKPLSGAVFPVK
jgi:hypothetical protein